VRSLSRRIRGRLTFANVTSCLALFVALGGTSYAAATLAANSVGTRQIRTNGVGKSEIKSSAVGVSEIATNGVGKGELATDAVGQSEIRKDSVGAGEIRTGAVGTSELQDAGIDLTDLSTTTKAALIPARAAVTKAGAAAAGNAQSATRSAAGAYTVTFDHDVSKCFYSATLAAVRSSATTVDPPDAGFVNAAPGAAAGAVDVRTFNASGAATDEPFHLLVAC
jgi:hypothetical protein